MYKNILKSSLHVGNVVRSCRYRIDLMLFNNLVVFMIFSTTRHVLVLKIPNYD